MLNEQRLALFRRRRQRGAVTDDEPGDQRRQARANTIRDCHGSWPHRGCVQTLSSAGCPDFTTATASLIAGASSAGSLIGPLAHQPIDSASLWYSMSGFSMLVPIGPMSLPRLATRLRKF